ncbi:hypothetical protein, partial [Candidatus Agathobaculum pullicola]|uniref:hypothetical protein n=1 Tax=Candidatus Agathobaculum pullicola TaxID=2838426 RepID=UPI003F92A81B
CDRIEPETDDKIRRMTPVGVFFIYPNEDKLGFVNSAKLSQSVLSYTKDRNQANAGDVYQFSFR